MRKKLALSMHYQWQTEKLLLTKASAQTVTLAYQNVSSALSKLLLKLKKLTCQLISTFGYLLNRDRARSRMLPLELLGEGKKLAKDISEDTQICAVLIGNNIDHLAQECFEYGAEKVYLVQDPLLKTILPTVTPRL